MREWGRAWFGELITDFDVEDKEKEVLSMQHGEIQILGLLFSVFVGNGLFQLHPVEEQCVTLWA